MKNIKSLNQKVPLVTIDKDLDRLAGKISFSKKLEVANKKLVSAKLPERKHFAN